MIVVIAGGRDLLPLPKYTAWLDDQYRRLGITGVVSGGASGADAIGESWARSNGLPVKVFPAGWQTHGAAAGPLRNAQMADFLLLYPQRAVLLFPGGRGTASMRNCAETRKIPVYEFGC